LVDEQGREYYVVDVPRTRTHRWVDAERTRVRLAHGIELDVVSYDDRHLRVKINGDGHLDVVFGPPRKSRRRTVKAVAADAGLVELHRQRESLDQVGVRPVEGRVEARDLR
jgi:hypothetical protein